MINCCHATHHLENLSTHSSRIFFIFQIGYLNNWFAWNPNARTFSQCFWFRPDARNMTAGLFFSQGVIEFYLDAGELVAVLGGDVLPCGKVSLDCLFIY